MQVPDAKIPVCLVEYVRMCAWLYTKIENVTQQSNLLSRTI